MSQQKVKSIDLIQKKSTVMFVGDFFTLMTTVILIEELREEDENDYDFSVRLASAFLDNYYGFKVLSASNDIGVVDEEGNDVDE